MSEAEWIAQAEQQIAAFERQNELMRRRAFGTFSVTDKGKVDTTDESIAQNERWIEQWQVAIRNIRARPPH